MKMLFIVFAFSLFCGGSFANDNCNATTCCYPELGCFTRLPPFDDLPLPEDPEKIAPVYWLYRVDPTNKTMIFDAITNASLIDMDNLVVTTHGFNGNMYNTPWHEMIIKELIKNRGPKLNVLFVDWSLGADKYVSFSGYKQAASNTRIIGAMATKFLASNRHFDPRKTYCLGFSLGTHICGFMAKHGGFKWQRLTALDPARPHFSKDDPAARVDKSDAYFMDVVHTSSAEGMQFAIGHVDLWVNNAKHQPGCNRFFRHDRRSFRISPKIEDDQTDSSIIDRIEDYVGCSHGRAAVLYYLSINLPPKCDFAPFCPCNYSEKDGVQTEYQNGTCPPEKQQHFGYEAVTSRLGSFCGKTTDKLPYYDCNTSGRLFFG